MRIQNHLKLKNEIDNLKKIKKDMPLKNKNEKRIELDFEKKLPSEKKVYEIVKQIYTELNETKNRKTFNLTEAIFMLRNLDDFSFFTKENGKIMFEKKIEVIDENNEIENNEKNNINDFTELEIKDIVKNFKLPKKNENEMLVAVLSGSSYIYPILNGLSCIYTNDVIRFIRDGNQTISEEWDEVNMMNPYSDLYTLVNKKRKRK